MFFSVNIYSQIVLNCHSSTAMASMLRGMTQLELHGRCQFNVPFLCRHMPVCPW